MMQRLHDWLWATRDLRALPRGRAIVVTVLRHLAAVSRDLVDGRLTLQAQSLVYTTLLSLVPLLAVAFAALKGLGVHNQLEPALVGLLAPLGDRGAEVARSIVGFVDNMHVGALGLLGTAMLLYTILSVMQKIESAFNFTWRVPDTRPLAQRLTSYLGTLVIGPLFLFVATGITAALLHNPALEQILGTRFGGLLSLVTGIAPYLLVTTAFACIYYFMPNARVRWRPAIVGALIAGVLWQLVGQIFARFVARSAQYAMVYSAFASAILFMIWIYLAWLVLLIGASIAFYVQHPEHLALPERQPRLSARDSERVALACMYLIARSHFGQIEAWTPSRLARHLVLPEELIESLLVPLLQGGLLVRSDDREPRYLPGRPLEQISAAEILRLVRSSIPGSLPGLDDAKLEEPVRRLYAQFDESVDAGLRHVSLRDLVRAAGDPEARDAPGQSPA